MYSLVFHFCYFMSFYLFLIHFISCNFSFIFLIWLFNFSAFFILNYFLHDSNSALFYGFLLIWLFLKILHLCTNLFLFFFNTEQNLFAVINCHLIKRNWMILHWILNLRLFSKNIYKFFIKSIYFSLFLIWALIVLTVFCKNYIRNCFVKLTVAMN